MISDCLMAWRLWVGKASKRFWTVDSALLVFDQMSDDVVLMISNVESKKDTIRTIHDEISHLPSSSCNENMNIITTMMGVSQPPGYADLVIKFFIPLSL
jgi:Mg2+ and Co2+ transporter CorA